MSSKKGKAIETFLKRISHWLIALIRGKEYNTSTQTLLIKRIQY